MAGRRLQLDNILYLYKMLLYPIAVLISMQELLVLSDSSCIGAHGGSLGGGIVSVLFKVLHLVLPLRFAAHFQPAAPGWRSWEAQPSVESAQEAARHGRAASELEAWAGIDGGCWGGEGLPSRGIFNS